MKRGARTATSATSAASRPGTRAASPGRRALSQCLLALHLVFFLVSGAFAARAPSHAPLHQAAATVLAGGSDRVAIASSAEPRVELASRSRTLREAGGAGPLHLDFDLPSLAVTVGPASQTGALDARAASRLSRPPPSVVHGPRGPPQRA